jgi:hypothetical protein
MGEGILKIGHEGADTGDGIRVPAIRHGDGHASDRPSGLSRKSLDEIEC